MSLSFLRSSAGPRIAIAYIRNLSPLDPETTVAQTRPGQQVGGAWLYPGVANLYSIFVSRSSSLAGVILAAGTSSRMGEEKALLLYGGRSFLAGAIELLQNACDFVIVVAGRNIDVLRPVVYQNSAYLVLNPQPETGQFSSLRLGLQAVLDRGRDTACVTLVDRPPAQLKTLQTLKQYFLGTSPETTWAVVPQFEGKHGHPVIFAREMMEALLRASSSSNAREIEHQNQPRIEYLKVDDPRVVLNINTPQDYSSLTATQ